jgi:DHA1 family multidrug resistance protein-like MFS transporter
VTPWKQTLVVVWLAQFLSMMGFAFGMPFAAYYLQTLGVGDKKELWVAVWSAATPLTLAVFSPIWGHLADRFGRRVMMLRAYAGGAVVLALMALVQSPLQLILLRLIQGVFTGTVTAAQTMVAVTAPRERSGTALGILSTSIFGGSMVGASLGGMLAEAFGYRASYIFAGILLLLSLLLTVFGTREDPVTKQLPPQALEVDEPKPERSPLTGGAVPILLLIFFMAEVRQFDSPFVPLLVQEINGGKLEGSALLSGILSTAGAIAGMLAGFFLGRLADRRHPPAIAKFCSLAASLIVLPQAIITTFIPLVAARFGLAFFAGGLDPVFLIWLAKVTPDERRGAIFGWAATAKSIGWIVAPLIGGVIAAYLGIRAIFYVEAVMFVLLVPCIAWAVRRIGRARGPAAEA